MNQFNNFTICLWVKRKEILTALWSYQYADMKIAPQIIKSFGNLNRENQVHEYTWYPLFIQWNLFNMKSVDTESLITQIPDKHINCWQLGNSLPTLCF